MLRKMLPVAEYGNACARAYAVEGTVRHVLELIAFGSGYASRYILLRSRATLERLEQSDETVLAAIGKGGSSLGRVLKAGELHHDERAGCLMLDLGPDES